MIISSLFYILYYILEERGKIPKYKILVRSIYEFTKWRTIQIVVERETYKEL